MPSRCSRGLGIRGSTWCRRAIHDYEDAHLGYHDPVRQIALGGFSLRCADTDRGEPVFFCLHGLADTLEVWDALAGPLAERGRLVRIDQRGHGESGAPTGPFTRD